MLVVAALAELGLFGLRALNFATEARWLLVATDAQLLSPVAVGVLQYYCG
jgi:hypothetical protein